MAHLGTFQREETIRIKSWTRDADGVLRDPSTHIKATIKDPQGVAQVDAIAMSNDGTGLDHYDYLSASTVSSGEWSGYIEAKSGTIVTRKPFTFTMEVV